MTDSTQPLEDYDGDWYKYSDGMVTTLCDTCHGASEYQKSVEKWPVNGRGEEARLDRLSNLRCRQAVLDDFD
jgi:hypothetical protein